MLQAKTGHYYGKDDFPVVGRVTNPSGRLAGARGAISLGRFGATKRCASFRHAHPCSCMGDCQDARGWTGWAARGEGRTVAIRQPGEFGDERLWGQRVPMPRKSQPISPTSAVSSEQMTANLSPSRLAFGSRNSRTQMELPSIRIDTTN